MSFKDFIKPTIGKISIVIILFLLTSSLYNAVTDITLFGSPLIYYEGSCFNPDRKCSSSFNILYLLSDLIIWYLISCTIIFFIMHAYNKLRKNV